MKIDFNEAVALLKSRDNILILTHRNPDGDTLGSGFALLRALRDMGKRARLINADPIPKKFSFLCDGIVEEDFAEEFVVSVDVAERKLLGESFAEKYGDKVDLAIDHHETSRLFAEKTYCESDSASCCEIVYLLIKAMGTPVTKEIEDCIYTGCSTDTGCFKYSNVTPRTHRIAAELIEAGADHSRINVRMFETKAMGDFMLQKMCLDTLEIFGEGKVAVISVTKDMLDECGVDKSALDAIKPITRQIEGVEIGITLKEERDGVIGVSVRTGESCDASAICAHFGGGGHMRAAGCEVKGTMEEALEKIKKYIIEEII
ncbi:MAG: bifunctional oligoribonuclease/PAP phosphatase NrnA [Clostridia bacterium]|nr:bifunctional oligoribonuclease/PAP phosphatase NrnA [Clostridia bacterium]